MENIIRYLKDLSEVWYEIGFNLKIPTTKLDDIEDEIESDEEGLTTMLKEWLQRKGQRTWREIIWAICKMLDSMNNDEDIGSEVGGESEDDEDIGSEGGGESEDDEDVGSEGGGESEDDEDIGSEGGGESEDDEDIGSERGGESEDDDVSEKDAESEESEDYMAFEEVATLYERMLHLAEPINGMKLTCKVHVCIIRGGCVCIMTVSLGPWGEYGFQDISW